MSPIPPKEWNALESMLEKIPREYLISAIKSIPTNPYNSVASTKKPIMLEELKADLDDLITREAKIHEPRIQKTNKGNTITDDQSLLNVEEIDFDDVNWDAMEEALKITDWESDLMLFVELYSELLENNLSQKNGIYQNISSLHATDMGLTAEQFEALNITINQINLVNSSDSSFTFSHDTVIAYTTTAILSVTMSNYVIIMSWGWIIKLGKKIIDVIKGSGKFAKSGKKAVKAAKKAKAGGALAGTWKKLAAKYAALTVVQLTQLLAELYLLLELLEKRKEAAKEEGDTEKVKELEKEIEEVKKKIKLAEEAKKSKGK